MLVSFSVSNFRSFDHEEHFSMEAGRTRNFTERTVRSANTKILKFKAMYGANASGKSNLISAMDLMKESVSRGFPSNASNDYCRINEENSQRPSKFEMEMVIDDIRYTYGFEVIISENAFSKEWLIEHSGKKEKTVFTRDINKGEYNVSSYVSSAPLNERLSIYADDVKTDSSILFLHIMNQNKDALYGDTSEINAYRTVYRWFRTRLNISYPNEPITQYRYFFNGESGARAEEVLSRLDTGISKVQIEDEPLEKIKSQFPKKFWQDIQEELSEQKKKNLKYNITSNPTIMMRCLEDHSMYMFELNGDDLICKTLKFKHKNSDSIFSLQDESDGTVRLLDLIEILLSTSSNMVYVIDEVSRCLHPLLTKQFIRDFLGLAQKRNIQLIITTHEVDLMDLDLLRQDEIGFVSRLENGSSKIYGLESFGARFDKRIRKAYLDGNYGAIPSFPSEKIQI